MSQGFQTELRDALDEPMRELRSTADMARRAIEEAGNRLARNRGSADVAGAQWACAVLGFAVGKVADADVRRYRTQTPGRGTQIPPAAPTMLPSTPRLVASPPFELTPKLSTLVRSWMLLHLM